VVDLHHPVWRTHARTPRRAAERETFEVGNGTPGFEGEPVEPFIVVAAD
jgi:hypothetical protein